MLNKTRVKTPDRVDFGSQTAQRDFFVKSKNVLRSKTWRQLFTALGQRDENFTLRAFRRWHLGQSLPPLTLVARICELTGEDLSKIGVGVRVANWGARKGGLEKVARFGCNLTLRDRVKGGRLVRRSNSVRHMRSIASLGGVNSLKSGRNPRRTVPGPYGIRMYNHLEKETFETMIKAGLRVEYEPVVMIGNCRIVPDFCVGQTYIECTCDRKVNVKTERLLEKFRLLKEHMPFAAATVVTLPHLVEKYRLYLGREASVVTLDDLVRMVSSVE